jgi:hypothetical protein
VQPVQELHAECVGNGKSCGVRKCCAVFQQLEVDYYIAEPMQGLDIKTEQRQVPIVRMYGANDAGGLCANHAPAAGLQQLFNALYGAQSLLSSLRRAACPGLPQATVWCSLCMALSLTSG